MNFKIIPSNQFNNHIKQLDKKSKRIIHDKIRLIKENPYRYKIIRSKKYSKVFRIRFSIDNRETRLIYVILEPNIILVCLLDRKHDYKDLEKYLSRIGK